MWEDCLQTGTKTQLLAVDISVLVTMTSAANCDNQREMLASVNHSGFESKFRSSL